MHTLGPSGVEGALLTDLISLSSEPKQPFPSAGLVPDRNRKSQNTIVAAVELQALIVALLYYSNQHLLAMCVSLWVYPCIRSNDVTLLVLRTVTGSLSLYTPQNIRCCILPLSNLNQFFLEGERAECHLWTAGLSAVAFSRAISFSFVKQLYQECWWRDWDLEASQAFQKIIIFTVTISVQITEPQTKSFISLCSELTVQIKFGFILIYSPPLASLLSWHWLIFYFSYQLSALSIVAWLTGSSITAMPILLEDC